MRNIKLYLVSIIFIVLFILPYTISNLLTPTNTNLYYIFLVGCYALCTFVNIKGIITKVYIKPLIFTFTFLFFAFINALVKGSVENFYYLAPIISYLGYYYLNNFKLKVSLIDFAMFFLYIYYGIVYYATLPSLLVHPEIEDFFIKASSNLIPITLNITLYAYMILNKFYDQNNQKKIVYFAIINVILILIQQSRAGIIISIFILFIASYEYSRQFANKIFVIVSLLTIILLSYYYQTITNYLDIIGSIGSNSLKEDIRGEAQSDFFSKMNFKNAFFGYSKGSFAGLDYTYNNLLDIWNMYGIVPFIVFILTLAERLFFHKNYKFPLYYFIPFFIYILVESRFFPNFWDIIIYLLLFVPRAKLINSLRIKNKNDQIASTV